MGLTVSRKLDESLAFRGNTHHPIETLLAGFHVGPLSRSSFILEFRNALFFKSRETGGLRELETDPGTGRDQATTHSIYTWNLARMLAMTVGGNDRRRAFSHPRHPYPSRNVFIDCI